jgi:hypothetical protein
MTLVDNATSVLVCGGQSGNMLKTTCGLYYIDSNVWTTYASLPVAMYSFTMITLQTRPFVFGGRQANNIIANTVYTFDSASWISRASMLQPLWLHTAVALNDSCALVCGGEKSDSAGSAQSACYTYSSTMDAWASTNAQLNTARWAHGMAMYKGSLHLKKNESNSM